MDSPGVVKIKNKECDTISGHKGEGNSNKFTDHQCIGEQVVHIGWERMIL